MKRCILTLMNTLIGLKMQELDLMLNTSERRIGLHVVENLSKS